MVGAVSRVVAGVGAGTRKTWVGVLVGLDIVLVPVLENQGLVHGSTPKDPFHSHRSAWLTECGGHPRN